ncbi:unnamed protein product [Linum trigynum]|uniref:Uncharacterized protein n=1 Tax=Linum trigynum TaxID=586398 RepID=A0AAV2GKE4_9ROSI
MRCVLTHTGNWVSHTAGWPARVSRDFLVLSQFPATSRGDSSLERDRAIPRERKRRTRVSKCPSSIFITIGGQFELGEVPINVQEQESILHSMNSASDSAFASFSME